MAARASQPSDSSKQSSDWHSRHVTGHCTFMNEGLVSHSPMAAHVAHTCEQPAD
jgi:hypothetical protein